MSPPAAATSPTASTTLEPFATNFMHHQHHHNSSPHHPKLHHQQPVNGNNKQHETKMTTPTTTTTTTTTNNNNLITSPVPSFPIKTLSTPSSRRRPSNNNNNSNASRNLSIPPHPLSQGLPPIYTSTSHDVMQDIVANSTLDDTDPDAENAFFVCDLSKVYEKVQLWNNELGANADLGPKHAGKGVEAFFAVKCNPDPVLICLLASLGLGFDCASHGEIANILSLGIDPSRIIYANPIKTNSFIRYAAAHQVDLMTFDNTDELDKIKKNHPNGRLVLRLAVDDEGSLCRFSSKFGAHLESVVPILTHARNLQLNVVGVSFHVGSGCTNPFLYDKALQSVKFCFNRASELGFNFDFVDIGGGFESHSFPEAAKVIRNALKTYFLDDGLDHVRIIAEPGRFFACEAFELATNIIGRRKNDLTSTVASTTNGNANADVNDLKVNSHTSSSDNNGKGNGNGNTETENIPQTMYYINDGTYGAFNCTIFDHQIVHPKILATAQQTGQKIESCSIWGPTCDSIDLICSNTTLPRLQVGDWLRWPSMGAYTSCAASNFNGFKRSSVHYTIGGGALVDWVTKEIHSHLNRGLVEGLQAISAKNRQ